MTLMPRLPPQIMTEPPLLQARGLNKRFGDVPALVDVNVTVFPGEVLGIVGESGSGKSTMPRMLNLEDTPDTGDYRLSLPEAPGNLFDLDRHARRPASSARFRRHARRHGRTRGRAAPERADADGTGAARS